LKYKKIQVKWYKDDVEVDKDNAQITYRSGVCTLEIFNCKMTDAGTYRCEAVNSLGSDSTDCILTVQGRGGEPIPFIPFRSRRIYDSNRTVETSRSNYDHLRINDFERSRSTVDVRRDSSSYRSSNVRHTRDDSLSKPPASSPTFSKFLNSVTVEEGETAEFSCQVTGEPEPSIEWLYNGEQISDSRKVRKTYMSGRASLFLLECKLEDEGEYSCRASNSAGSDTSKGNLFVNIPLYFARIILFCRRRKASIIDENVRSDLTETPMVNGNLTETPLVNGDLTETPLVNGVVKETPIVNSKVSADPPKVSVLNDDQAAEEVEKDVEQPLQITRHIEPVCVAANANAAFTASVSGVPDEVIWMKNGRELKSEGNIVISENNNVYQLEVNQVAIEDHGVYQFEARRKGKTAFSVASLVVLGRPVEPNIAKLPQSVNVRQNEPTKFVLELENADHLSVQWFKGADKVDKSDRIKSVKSGNAFKLDFKSVELSDEGVYVVKLIKDKKAICKYAAAMQIVL
ncbi:unnamed protein product, partial [Enterobius vermicularis]|uniref:Titin n=1 Tax=Enterobius vermicularis TaxID=51028 RepID=A0A0N4VPM2_ENTVE